MIREVKREELSACADLIRKSFQTVADEFGFTRENAPRFTAFATTEERLIWHMDGEHRLMFLDEEDGRICGYSFVITLCPSLLRIIQVIHRFFRMHIFIFYSAAPDVLRQTDPTRVPAHPARFGSYRYRPSRKSPGSE